MNVNVSAPKMDLKCYLPHCEEAYVLPSLALWIVISPSGMWNIFTEKVNTEQAVVNLSIVVSFRHVKNLIFSIWKTILIFYNVGLGFDSVDFYCADALWLLFCV